VEITHEVAKRPPGQVVGRLSPLIAELATAGEFDTFRLVCRNLVETCSAQSAGISIVDEHALAERIKWVSVEGLWSDRSELTWPEDACFCTPALHSGRLTVLDNPASDFVAARADPPIEEVMLAPLVVGGIVRGVLWGATHDEDVRLNPADLQRLIDLCNLAAIGCRQGGDGAAPPLLLGSRTTSQLDALRATLAGEQHLNQALEEILSLARTITGSPSGFVVLGDELGESSHALVAQGAAEGSALMAYIASPEGGEACLQAVAAGGRVEVEDLTVLDVSQLPTGQVFALGEGIRSFQATPIVSRRGALLGVLSTQHGSAWRTSEAEGVTLDLLALLAADFIERYRSQETLGESEERLAAAVKVGRIGLWDWNVRTGAVHWSDEHFHMQGYQKDEVTPSFDAWVARIHPDDKEGAVAAVQDAMETRSEFAHEFRSLHPDGTIRWLSGRGRFFYDRRGNPLRMIGAMIDTTDKQEAMARQQTLVAELQHRVRNILSIVRYVFTRTMEMTRDTEDAARHFRGRLDALARTQVVVTQSPGGRADLDTLVRDELFSVGQSEGARISIGGPDVGLDAVAAENLGLALHELTMNAVKYGALLSPTATLSITWDVEQTPEGRRQLALTWQERGLPLVPLTGRRSGFGRELIESALPYTLGAQTNLEFGPGSVCCRIFLELDPEDGKSGRALR